MKSGHYITIDKAFKNYRQNLDALKNCPFQYISGVDYSKPSVCADKTINGSEERIISSISKKEELEKKINLVKKTYDWFSIEGYGRERYIKIRYLEKRSCVSACMEIGIAEITGKRWKRDIYEKAETIGEQIGLFL